MTHTPPESKAWPNAGAADRPSASGEQTQRQSQGLNQRQGQDQSQGGQPASDLPSAAADETVERTTPTFPEAGRHEGDTPARTPSADGRSGSESERS
jgi:hypothetical protein